MKITVKDQNTLLITHRLLATPLVMIVIGALVAFGGLVAAIDEDQWAGWLGVLLGVALLGMGVAIIASPDRAEFDRAGDLLTSKRMPSPIRLSSLSGAQVVEIVKPSTKGTPVHSNFVQVTFTDGSKAQSIHQQSVRQTHAVAARDAINDFLGTSSAGSDIQVIASATGLLIGTRDTGPDGIGPIRDVPRPGN